MQRAATLIYTVIFVAVVLAPYCVAASGQVHGIQYGEAPVSSAPGSVKFAVDESVVTSAVPMVHRALRQLIGNITVPAQSVQCIKLEEMQVSNITIGNMSLKLKSPNKLLVSVWDMAASVPETKFHYCLICCSFIPYIRGASNTYIHGANASFTLDLSVRNDGLLNVTVRNMMIELGEIDLRATIGGIRLLDSVINMVIDIFKGSIKSELQRIVPGIINPVVQSKAEEIFRGFPIIYMKDPNITEQRAELLMGIFPDESSSRVVSQDEVLAVDQSLPYRSVSITSSYRAANNVLRLLNNWSMLNVSLLLPERYNSSLIEPMYPELFRLCRGCNFGVSAVLPSPPWLETVSGGAFIFNSRNGNFTLEMVSEDNVSFTVLNMVVNLTANVRHMSIDNNTLDLKLSSMDVVTELGTSLIDGLNSTTLNTDIRRFLDEVGLPLFNADPHGFRLPFNISGLLLSVSNATITVGLDPKPIFPLLNKFVDRLV
ncbi:expression site-associated gene (ESAG) protein,putative [Trypanosoma brucei gambiense DAL972]|uniref:Expression site-associated gene 5 (ESAG5) protein, putative n=1 Tax=Trypanosoma brucei gambiense (strain MHOM/CI/86/DAL972) TaxID=679716 RepID=C9ZZR3_TRYB9|nr:expression site-associated gene (ESAG) protein,putative [Trypanosoma brucei gambiense DAL972]CBH14912.1 expression site-associated gene (ESAG) protein,putative [Trypanosoma brucei gambiense DAL972]|eukprot:XP_011777178.1 expression site-associated gene (ESAG) protein,putative [Trypanosoma brucei gambiense DAL972]